MEEKVNENNKSKETEILKEEDFTQLKAALEKKEKEAEEYFSYLQRLQADFENYKKRVQKERRETIELVTESLILSLLPVIDNFERAIKTVDKNSDPSTPLIDGRDSKALLEGINLIYKQLIEFLDKVGVKSIKTEGEIFDPNYHEAIVIEEIEEGVDGSILEELQKGYTLNLRVIRPAKVKVAKLRSNLPALIEDEEDIQLN